MNAKETKEANREPDESATTRLSRFDKYLATFELDHDIDLQSWSEELTIVNAINAVEIVPLHIDRHDGGCTIVLLGTTKDPVAVNKAAGDDDAALRRFQSTTTTNLAVYLEDELGAACTVERLAVSREHPELLRIVHSSSSIIEECRMDQGGHIEIAPEHFLTLEERNQWLEDECARGIERGNRMLVRIEFTLHSEDELDRVCAGLSIAKDERVASRITPYCREDTPNGIHLTLVGETPQAITRRNTQNRSIAKITTKLEKLTGLQPCVRELQAEASNPEDMRLRRSFERPAQFLNPRRMHDKITPDMFRPLTVVLAEEQLEQKLSRESGKVFVGTLRFPAGTDMKLVARVNGVLRSETGMRIVPTGSHLDDDGSRVVSVVGMRASFFGASEIGVHDLMEIQERLGCTVDVRLIAATMKQPDDVELYADAREALSSPHAATSVRAWTQPENAHSTENIESGLIGMQDVLARIDEMVAYAVHYRALYGCLPQLHAVFTGNPGTGKTTVARLLAKKLAEAGVLERSDRFVETDRSGLVGAYVGHTALKTHRIVDKAIGGMLFIDEAYSLNKASEIDYGHEAVDALVKRLEDDADQFVCIMAGYTREMDQMLSMNPGLRSRLPFKVEFPDYSADELVLIFDRMLDARFSLDEEARDLVADFLTQARAAKAPDFANARSVRNLAQRLQMRQLMRGSKPCIDAETVRSVVEEPDMARLAKREGGRPIGFTAA